MPKMASIVGDKRAKIERKGKKWRFKRIMDIFEYIFTQISYMTELLISKMSSIWLISKFEISKLYI